jgi:hypothetical protein
MVSRVDRRVFLWDIEKEVPIYVEGFEEVITTPRRWNPWFGDEDCGSVVCRDSGGPYRGFLSLLLGNFVAERDTSSMLTGSAGRFCVFWVLYLPAFLLVALDGYE